MTVASQAKRPVGAVFPFTLEIDVLAAMLNAEFADHEVYDGGELQWFDDDDHGTGMLAFLSRRDDRRVDYYVQAGLRVDPGGYEIGGGTGSWTEIDFDVARLVVTDHGVDAEARFTDIDGRLIELHVDDRDTRLRRPAGLLAPVSAAIERPVSLLLVWMPRFDLVRTGGVTPVVRIDGVQVATGRLPGMRLHRRHLIKYAAPVVTVQLNPSHTGPLTADGASGSLGRDPDGFREVVAQRAGHHARLTLQPPVPDLASLADGSTTSGRFVVECDGSRLTGGSWALTRTGDEIEARLDVDERWRPGRLPWLMRLVTTVMPVFRRWPTTYRWRACVHLDAEPTVTARWERSGGEQGRGYRRATRS